MRKKSIRLAFISAVIPVLAFAAQDWAWNTQSGYTGQVDLGTSGSVASLSTMTSGSANIAGNGAVQPPLVVNVQAGATASLPIKNIGDACTSTTSGTAPNQTADEGTAITADRSSLLTCQSGSLEPLIIRGEVA